MAVANADELVRTWAKTKVRFHLPDTPDYLHYKDCPDIQVFACKGAERAVSSVTPDRWTYFKVLWGCPHGPGRLTAQLHYQGTMIDLIHELDELHEATADLQVELAVEELTADPDFSEPIFAANYPAPGGGTTWQRPASKPPWA